jgi:Fic family protein
MSLPLTLEQLSAYLTVPDRKRPMAWYQEDLLEPHLAFSAEEVERLSERVHLPEFSVRKLLLDLSWASSHLEGNSYTRLETQVLLDYGQKNDEKPVEDAVMILNHKQAIEHMLSNLALTEENVCKIHALLADNRNAPDSGYFLEAWQCGTIRSYTPDGLYIHGSAYIPPQAEDRPSGYLEQEFSRLIASANELPDAINQSFFMMTRLPYLQAFYDVNKRTSRISCNIPLIRDGLSPLSFVALDKTSYLNGILAFYELGDEQLAKHAFLDAYLDSASRFLPLE